MSRQASDAGPRALEQDELYPNSDDDAQDVATTDAVAPTTSANQRPGTEAMNGDGEYALTTDPATLSADDNISYHDSEHWGDSGEDDIVPSESASQLARERPRRRLSSRRRRGSSESHESLPAPNRRRWGHDQPSRSIDRNLPRDRDSVPPPPFEQPHATSSSSRPVKGLEGPSPFPSPGSFQDYGYFAPLGPTSMPYNASSGYSQYPAGHHGQLSPSRHDPPMYMPASQESGRTLDSLYSHGSMWSAYHDRYDRETPSLAYMLPPPGSITEKAKSRSSKGAHNTAQPVPMFDEPLAPHLAPSEGVRLKQEARERRDSMPAAQDTGNMPSKTLKRPDDQFRHTRPRPALPAPLPQSYRTPSHDLPNDSIAAVPHMPQLQHHMGSYPMPRAAPIPASPAYATRINPYAMPPQSMGYYDPYSMPPPPQVRGSGPTAPLLPPPPPFPWDDHLGHRMGWPDPFEIYDLFGNDAGWGTDVKAATKKVKKRARRVDKKVRLEKAPLPMYRGYSLETAEATEGKYHDWDSFVKRPLPYDDARFESMIKWHRLKSKDESDRGLSQLTSAQRRAVNEVVSHEQTTEWSRSARWVLADVQCFGQQRFGKLVETRSIQIILRCHLGTTDPTGPTHALYHGGEIVDLSQGFAKFEKPSIGRVKLIEQKNSKGKWPSQKLPEPPLPPWPSEPLWVYRARDLTHEGSSPNRLIPVATRPVHSPPPRSRSAKSEGSAVSMRSHRSRASWRRQTHSIRAEPSMHREHIREQLENAVRSSEPHDVQSRVDGWRESVVGSQDGVLNGASQTSSHEQVTLKPATSSLLDHDVVTARPSKFINWSVRSAQSTTSLVELVKHADDLVPDHADFPGTAEQVPLPMSSASSVRTVSSLGLDGADMLPLPPSVTSTSANDNEMADPFQATGSIPQIADAGDTVIDPAELTDAMIAGRNEGSLNRRPARVTGQQERSNTSDYLSRVTALVHSMPHLKVLQQPQCRQVHGGLVTRLDYYDNINHPRRSKRKTFDHRYWLGASPRMRKKAFKHATDPRVYLRVFMVEDLSPQLIETLGSTFDIDPEVFAEHLNRCGFQDHMYNEALPSRWKTNKMPKSYYSLRWYRPVRQSPKMLAWLQSPEQREKLYTDGVRWSDVSHERFGETITEKQTHHCVSLKTNIGRQSWPLSTRPLDGSSDTVAAAWEERATIFFADQGSASTLIILLDPLPKFTDQTVVEEQDFVPSRLIPRSRLSNASTDFEDKLIPAFMPMLPRTPVEFPTNKISATLDQIQTLETVTTEASSTAADVESWIWRTSRARYTIPNITADPIIAILRLAHIDSIAFLDSLEWTLDEINRDSLDDRIMTERLLAWRKLMSDLEIEVPAIARSLRGLVKPDHASYAEALPMLDELDARVSSFMRRMAGTYGSLRADMALLDSRQSIAEAQTVTKLTELAFAFIPLTFACSLFSMQITELQDGAPLWTFFVTAVTLALLSYALRLLVQSGAIGNGRRRAQQYALASGWKDSARPAPAGFIMQYLLKDGLRYARSGSGVVVFMLALLPSVLPIAFLWARNHLDVGLNAMMTVLIVPAGIFLAWCCARGVLDAGSEEDEGSETSSTQLSSMQKFGLRIARLLPPWKSSVQSSSSSSV